MIGRPVGFTNPCDARWQYGEPPSPSSLPPGTRIVVWQAGFIGVVAAWDVFYYDEKGNTPWGGGKPFGHWCFYIEPVIPLDESD